jgi:Peptidase propeptide and YPEB domain
MLKTGTIICGLVLAATVITSARADRDPTDQERARIEEFLRSEGFSDWGPIELHDEAWEVEGAESAETGEGYDLKLDPTTLEIIERTED